MEHIESISTEDTGGNIVLDVVHLKNGMVLVISDEVTCLYSDRDWQLGGEPISTMSHDS